MPLSASTVCTATPQVLLSYLKVFIWVSTGNTPIRHELSKATTLSSPLDVRTAVRLPRPLKVWQTLLLSPHFRLHIIKVTGAFSSTFPFLAVAVAANLLMALGPSRALWETLPTNCNPSELQATTWMVICKVATTISASNSVLPIRFCPTYLSTVVCDCFTALPPTKQRSATSW